MDGGYLRVVCQHLKQPLANPGALAHQFATSGPLRDWDAAMRRVRYYDGSSELAEGWPDPDEVRDYWDACDAVFDVELGFGGLRSRRRGSRESPRKQKGVDTLLAVDMLSGAVDGLMEVAVLIAGDAEFAPLVEEVKRRGVLVAVAAQKESLSRELRRAADRVVELRSPVDTTWTNSQVAVLLPMVDGPEDALSTWWQGEDGKVERRGLTEWVIATVTASEAIRRSFNHKELEAQRTLAGVVQDIRRNGRHAR